MGGSIGITIRKSNGEEIRRCRWTNALPSIFNNVRFLTSDESYLDEYIKRGESMRNDWLKNKNTEQFEFNMTPVYGPYDTLAPVEYGLVVIDYKTKHVLSLQGYCNAPDCIPSYFLCAGITFKDNNVIFEEIMNDDKENHKLAREFFDQRKIKSFEYYDVLKEDFCEVDVNYNDFKSFEDFLLKLSEISDNKRVIRHINFSIDTGDWTVKEFSEDLKGYLEMKKFIQEDLGFVLTEADEKDWEEHLSHYREEDEEVQTSEQE